MCLVGHLRERLVVAERAELVERAATPFGVVLPHALHGLQVRGDGLVPVDQGGGAVVRPPEVHDVGGERARGILDAHQRRFRADQHGHRGGALGRFAGTGQVVLRDVARDHEDLLRAVPVDEADGELQARRRAVAGLFQLDHPGGRGQSQQRMDVDSGRLRLVDGRLRREDDRPDPVGAVPGHDRGGRGGGHGHDVLVGGGHAHRPLADTRVVLGDVGAVLGRQCLVRQNVLCRRDREVVNSDGQVRGHR